MSVYEKRLKADKDHILARLKAVSEVIDSNLKSAHESFAALDHELASETILRDHPVNRAIRDLDHDCHAFVARHLPGAKHLRFISSALRLNIELERIGDYAASVGRETVQLGQLPGTEILGQIDSLASDSRELLRKAVEAFTSDSVELANQVIQEAKRLESRFTESFQALTREEKVQPLSASDLTAVLVVLTRFSRVRAQAKNVAEETIFVVTGQPFASKRYQILFVDLEGHSLAPLAAAYASKVFPESGEYTAAALSPSETIKNIIISTASKNGLSLAGFQSLALQDIDDLSKYSVIVALEKGVRGKLLPLPFHSLLLRRQQDPSQHPDELLRGIADLVSTLMTTLSGNKAG
jgi:phosphate transport system protein